MTSDPLQVLLSLNKTLDEDLIVKCYELQQKHQYDKDRDISQKLEALIEEFVVKAQGDNLL